MKRSKYIAWAIIALALVGFIDATYLAVKYYLGGPIACVIFTGCDTVATSPYSMFGPIPLALIGSVFYLSTIVLAGLFLDLKKTIFLRILTITSAAAFLESVFLTSLQIWVIKAYCVYCLLSAGIATAIFILVLLALPPRKPGSALLQNQLPN